LLITYKNHPKAPEIASLKSAKTKISYQQINVLANTFVFGGFLRNRLTMKQ